MLTRKITLKKIWTFVVTIVLVLGVIHYVSANTAAHAGGRVDYVDALGNSHRATNVTSVTSDLDWIGSPGTETWYVVDSDMDFGRQLKIYGNVNLILADNIEFIVGDQYGIYVNDNSSLTIYSQSHGESKGKLTATGSSYSRVTNLTINGGQISFTGSAFGVYIANGGSMTVNNGYVTINSTANNSTAINDVNLFHINGGTAIGNGNNIGKATPTVTAPKPNPLIYTASEQYLVTAGTTTHGKILYSTDGENYSEDIPKGIEAGTYTVYYKIDEGDTWFAVEPKTVSVSIRPAYTYVNADGEPQPYVEAEVVSRKNLGTRGHTSWYIVNEDVTFSDFMQISGTVNLILADGKELTVNNAESNYGIYISEDSSLNIYTQSHGDNKGKLTVSTEGHGISIYNNGSLTINGGLISITSTGYRHNGVNFSSDGSMTIRNGDVTILSEKYEAINDSSKLILTGGLLNSYGYGSQETIENTNYLDATGSQLSVNATVIKNGSQSIGTAEQTTWYVLKNDLSLPNGFEINGNVNIILADGVTMTVNNTSDNCIYIPEEGSLSIYTQSHGDNKGKLTVSSGTKGIVIKKSSLIINGGLISITGNTNGVYFDTDGSMTIKNGDVTIVGQNDKAVNDMDKITKQGGNLTLKNYGLTVFGYLDASGVPQWHEAVELSNNNFNIGGGVDKTTWYVVKENLVFNTKVMIAGDVHLILEDGAEMTIDATSVDYGIYIPEESSLTIYSQSTGDNKGKLTAEAHTGIMISKSTSSLTINGGEITVFGGDNYESVCNYGTITINGGQNIFTSKSGTEGFKSYAGSTLTLGYNSVNDFIQIDGTYNVDTILGTINVKNGQTLTDGLNNAYNGTLNETQVIALSGKKLVPAYAVNIAASTGGTVTADKNAFDLNASGESVTLTVTPNTGYKFKSLVINNGAVSVTDNQDGIFTFVMPTGDVTVTVEFELIDYTVTKSCANGTVTTKVNDVDSAIAHYGDTVTVTAIPNEGYGLITYTVRDTDGNIISVIDNTFTMPASNIIVTAVFAEPKEPIAYIDADGTQKTVEYYTVLNESQTELTEGWYVVNSISLTVNNTLKPSGNVNIILVDGCFMIVNTGTYSLECETYTNLCIYGQNKGTGEMVLNSNASGTSVKINGSLTINGGIWESYKTYISGTDSTKDCFTINGGDIFMQAFYSDAPLEIKGGKCSINGGKVELQCEYDNSWSITSDCGITLGYKKGSDYIKFNKSLSNSTVTIAEGKKLTDGTNEYSGDVAPSELSGKTLVPVKFTVAVTPKDTNGTEISVQGIWLKEYIYGAEVTLTAPAKEGYNFSGWYEETAEKCKTNTYTFTITSNVDLIAKYKPLGNATLTIDGGSDFKINNDTKSTSITANYPLGSEITVETNDDKFAYWKNSYGMVLSRSRTYTFTVTGADTITAVFDTVVDNKATLVFESAYGQIMAREQLASGGTMTLPGLPTRNGYKALGWDLNCDGQFDSTSDTIAAAIEKGLAANDNKVTIKPVYDLKIAEYDISVTGGTGAGKYNQDVMVTVKANAPEEGKKFSHWEDENGKILSYSTTFSFFAEMDISLTAIYVLNTEDVIAVGTTEIINMYKEDKNLIFVSMSTVPEGCTIIKAGAIATDNSSIAASEDDFQDDNNNVYVLGDAWSGDAYRYTLTVSDVSSGETWYARAYLVYTDVSGNTLTVYGDIVYQTY